MCNFFRESGDGCDFVNTREEEEKKIHKLVVVFTVITGIHNYRLFCLIGQLNRKGKHIRLVFSDNLIIIYDDNNKQIVIKKVTSKTYKLIIFCCGNTVVRRVKVECVRDGSFRGNKISHSSKQLLKASTVFLEFNLNF